MDFELTEEQKINVDELVKFAVTHAMNVKL